MENLDYQSVAFNIVFALSSLFSVLLLWERPVLVLILLALIALIGLLKWKTKTHIILFLFCGLFGPVAEALAVFFGIWNYTLPEVLNVPLWLFILWGNAALFIYQSGEELKKLGV